MNLSRNFIWCPLDNCEDVRDYRTGWYHPVHVGDIYPADNPQYRILNKIDYNTFSTVWLAEHIPSGRAVALKILIADLKNSSESQEIQILRSLPRSPHLLEILDSFTISGPNGEHNVVVSEVLFPARAVWDLFWRKMDSTPKQFIQHILEGLAVLHEHEIVHGGLYFDNLAFRFPEVAEMDAKTWLIRLSPPRLIPVLPCNPNEELSPSLPKHLLPTFHIEGLQYNFEKASRAGKGPVAVIANFSTAYHMNEPPPRRLVIPPLHFRPPELLSILQRSTLYPEISCENWGVQGDIWILACTMYRLEYGMAPFSSALDEYSLVWYMREKIGLLPPFLNHLVSSTRLNGQPFSSACERKGKLICELIDQMLEYDPRQRPSARALLQHPYLTRKKEKPASEEEQGAQEMMH